MKLLIVDDEAPARARLQQLAADIAGCEVVGEAVNGQEALQLAEAHNPDVLLLDIRMPGMDGIETARHLMNLENPPAVIFTTAYNQHALEAFDVNAAAYLMKPVRRERLEAALGAVTRPNRAQLAALGHSLHEPRRHICARLRGRLMLVPIEDVRYFHADQKYVTVRHSKGELLIEEALKSLEEEFSTLFMRVHRNALVALDHITGLEKDAHGHWRLRLRDCPETLEVSRRLTADVRKRLKTI